MLKRFTSIFLLLYCLFGFGQTGWAYEELVRAVGVNPSQEAAHAYTLASQNLIQIKILGDSSSNQIYRLDEMGAISHALVGRVKLGGLTVTEAERLMESKLTGDYIINPHVNILVLEYSRFSIVGEVNRPGAYEISGRISVIEAISMAGSFTRVADQRGVRVVRKKEGNEMVIKVDATDITERGSRADETYIEANDVIVVPKSFF